MFSYTYSRKHTIFLNNTIMHIYIIIRYWVCLFVRYRNLLPVVQFQNQAHIRNPHGTGQVFKIIWGAAGAPNFLFFLYITLNTAKGGGFLNGCQGRRRRARDIPPKRVFCEYIPISNAYQPISIGIPNSHL